MRKPRKHRVGEVNCNCRAYKFPHRMMGGDCTGADFIDAKWEIFYGCGPCAECIHLRDDDGIRACQVKEGAEPAMACPLLMEHIALHEIKLYGWRYA